MLAKGKINIRFDSEADEYYIAWEPVVIGMGRTRHEALEDLRTAAHFYVDSLIDVKKQYIGKRKED